MTAPAASDARLRGEPVARAVFTGLPARYDRLAYLLSFGQDRRWRRAVTDHAAAAGPRVALDVATGPAGGARAGVVGTGHPRLAAVPPGGRQRALAAMVAAGLST